MSLSIVAAKDIEQAIEILASRPRKTVKDHLAEEPEGVGNFLYDFRAAFTNYQCYHFNKNDIIKVKSQSFHF